MKFGKRADLDDNKFRCLAGAKHLIFNRMLSILQGADKEEKSKDGRQNKLGLENMLLMALA
ncbi:hypothetical protein [Parachlamydia sp. AcF125]|uniref:hypothetical protein n=1 Tax=Parachlamydia sp. AcF125 TaxID=2795736 RepID=UPI001BC9184C|nr:hypothetical protein [Parachlamydia sp. AcF125]MBS4168646.1 hypothetical protein [Parachlamydia sp. AcF125]